jgi:hypothetical protein
MDAVLVEDRLPVRVTQEDRLAGDCAPQIGDLGTQVQASRVHLDRAGAGTVAVTVLVWWRL